MKIASWRVSLALWLAAAASLCLAPEIGAHQAQDINKIEWWKKTNFYHIYIRSFKDTDGNGQGDLRGIVEKLDYLKEIGVETLLLSPFYSSPMKDGGYDIDDYTAINPLFGTMEDFDRLLAGLKQRQMRLVVDFVPNHSSNLHPWFRCSERAYVDPENCAKYKDYYIWSNSTRFANYRPTNWISLFGGQTAWRWSEIRKEFYFHQFLPEQPDLNLRNPLVREEFKEIARFWLRKGVDGLRIDAVLHFLEDKQWRDEPQDPQWRPHWNPYDRLLHIFTRSLSESATVVKDWRLVAEEPEFAGQDKLIITEAYDEIPKLIEYYGPNAHDRYAHMPFNFELFKINQETMEPHFVERTVTDWLNATMELGWPTEHGAMNPWTCWVTGNHDNKRPVNRVGDFYADAYKMLTYLLPGAPVSYYGDEIGLYDADFDAIPQRTINEGEPTRLIFRAPMAWSPAEPAAGFSTNASTWMPLNPTYKQNNVMSQLNSSHKNHLKNFIQLQKLRSTFMETLTFGGLKFFMNEPGSGKESSRLFAMSRVHEKFGNLLLLINFSNSKSETIKLRVKPESVVAADEASKVQLSNWHEPPKRATVQLVNNLIMGSPLVEGRELELEGLFLAPAQAAIFSY